MSKVRLGIEAYLKKDSIKNIEKDLGAISSKVPVDIGNKKTTKTASLKLSIKDSLNEITSDLNLAIKRFQTKITQASLKGVDVSKYTELLSKMKSPEGAFDNDSVKERIRLMSLSQEELKQSFAITRDEQQKNAKLEKENLKETREEQQKKNKELKETEKEYERLTKLVQRFQVQLSQASTEGVQTSDYIGKLTSAQAYLSRGVSGTNLDTLKSKLKDIASTMTELSLKQVENKSLENMNRQANATNTSLDRAEKLLNEVSVTMKTSAINKYTNELESLQREFLSIKESGDNIPKQTKDFELLRQKVLQYNRNLKEADKTQRDWGKQLKENIKKFTEWFTAANVVMKTLQLLKQMVSVVVELDKAFTDVQMVVGYNNKQMVQLRYQYTQLAKSMKTTVTEVANGANEWLKY